MSDAAPAPRIRLSEAITGSGGALQWRYVKDKTAKYSVGIGGITVLLALLLIFVYLLTEVLPLFRGAHVAVRAEYTMPGDSSPTRYFTAEEQAEIGMRVAGSGELTFFDLATGAVREQERLPIGERQVLDVVEVIPEQGYLAASLSDGSILLFKHAYKVSYPDDKRFIDPGLEFPHGAEPLPFLNEPVKSPVVRDEGGELLLAGLDAKGQVRLKLSETESSLFGGSTQVLKAELTFAPSVMATRILVNPLIDWLYVVDDASGRIAFHQLRGEQPPELINTESAGDGIRHARFLPGGISVVTANDRGEVTQWFPARKGDDETYLAKVRDFETAERKNITALGAELRRRGFAVGDESGRITAFYSTSDTQMFEVQAFDGPVQSLAFEPRAKSLMALSNQGQFKVYEVENEHPEVSWSALWGKVWYESYDDPKFLWQSSSASQDFEPKFSLTPLTLGTLKGAFYAMIFAVPLAVLGAIFTANFMSPQLRQAVKPTVEIMQALPTVILGFLAGLWMAPFIESNLPGVFLTLLLLPLSIPIFGYLWMRMPQNIRWLVPDGWEAALLIPVIAGVVWFCFVLAKPIEALFFAGNMQSWMDQTLGIGYEQRNCLVVGIAMGVAVIPGIFSIAEDAIFSVPKQLSLGSLALGATPWQTLMGVVLPTASPGIFSAVMIGLGRAVGETMIVLMATGNTPVTDFSLFTGMRTLSANVAVEMPESEVGSTHFRLLFLAGLVLFVLTFFFNTVAEVVRQNLRKKYGNI